MLQTINGESIPESEIRFDELTYHFYWGERDITSDLYRRDKVRLVPGFNVERENYRLSSEAGFYDGFAGAPAYGQEPLNTGIIGPAINNLVTDPFSAPIESLGNVSNRFFGNSGVAKLLLFGALIFAAYVYIAGGWFRRR